MNKFLEKTEMLFAAILIVSFFLPWASIGGLISISGYNVPDALKGISALGEIFAKGEEQSLKGIYLSYLLYLIPLLSIIIIVLGMKDYNTKIISICTGFLPFLFLIYLLMNEFNVFEVASIGVYLTLIAGLCLILSAFGIIKFKKKVEN
ncbi:MAG TPA: hypothetical protein PL059_03320 [Spirochaetota bacterium]|nr:hypothetical protein [Spirochaetota bacterium]HOJ28080.1 hypothetical protein [Spirochaetota bacterium]